MARNNRPRPFRGSVRLTRQSPNPSLGHTVSRLFGGGFSTPDDPPDLTYPTGKVRTPLIRTVLEIPAPPNPPRRSTPRSPVLSARATGRSSDRKARSSFLTAQGITPELTNRAIVCASRTIRREVLFARKQTGKGSKSPRRYRSKVKC
ncbi:MAG: hypothetical protein [Arizlama microvirus]|nr:MAG: hypothetical protein [Arizlama microvirus]